ncbi:hypothetical protein EVAR_33919_1 [Eumeta japonica]|uniref:Uncharacterized protein n=1 Tax=Eumeta variegata TaxID=151549 RepID=A0A4C1VX39_EUMVA|nr:hypothetical protein EVAR_33919_1 [Eumeta japonica]
MAGRATHLQMVRRGPRWGCNFYFVAGLSAAAAARRPPPAVRADLVKGRAGAGALANMIDSAAAARGLGANGARAGIQQSFAAQLCLT